MASRSAVAATDEEDRPRELERQVRSSQRQMSDLHRHIGHDDDDDERQTAAAAAARRHGAGQSTHSGDRNDHHHRRCRLETLDVNADRQRQLLQQLQRQRACRTLDAALLDDMYQQQRRVAEVSALHNNYTRDF